MNTYIIIDVLDDDMETVNHFGVTADASKPLERVIDTIKQNFNVVAYKEVTKQEFDDFNRGE